MNLIKWKITNRHSGHEFGEYEAVTAHQAIAKKFELADGSGATYGRGQLTITERPADILKISPTFGELEVKQVDVDYSPRFFDIKLLNPGIDG